MIFNKGIWRLPTLTRQKASDLHHHKYVSSLKGSSTRVADTNPYCALLELAYETEPDSQSTDPVDIENVSAINKKIVQMIHDKWGHPSNTKMEQIVRYYKHRGFPPGFLRVLCHFKCKVCACCKSALVYKHTKHMKEKMVYTKANNKRRKPSQGGDCATAHTVEQQVLEAEITKISEEDDLLQAFRSEELHLDFAHLITLGYFKESCQLVQLVPSQPWENGAPLNFFCSRSHRSPYARADVKRSKYWQFCN
eukprot:836867-Rhodomonas_salina.1